MEESGQLHALVSLPPGGKSPWYPLDSRLQSLDAMEKRKTSCPCQELNPSSLDIQPTAHCYTNWGIPAPLHNLCSWKSEVQQVKNQLNRLILNLSSKLFFWTTPGRSRLQIHKLVQWKYLTEQIGSNGNVFDLYSGDHGHSFHIFFNSSFAFYYMTLHGMCQWQVLLTL
jgi:hypothetical protein